MSCLVTGVWLGFLVQESLSDVPPSWLHWLGFAVVASLGIYGAWRRLGLAESLALRKPPLQQAVLRAIADQGRS